MIVKVIQRYERGAYFVELVQGNQSFVIDTGAIKLEDQTQKRAKWFAKMFRNALKNHDVERDKRKK